MTNETAAEVSTISPADAKAKLDSGAAVLVDVRLAAEFAASHAAGAINLAGNSVKHKQSELPADKEVIFIGADDAKVKRVADAGVAAGIKSASLVEGGLTAWSEAGLPVENGSSPASGVGTISPAEAKALTDIEVAAFVDVRMPYDWAGERIPGSINLPNVSIKARKGEVPEDREVIFTSWDDAKSRTAAEAALGLGFKTVYVLEGGQQAWSDANLPTETISG